LKVAPKISGGAEALTEKLRQKKLTSTQQEENEVAKTNMKLSPWKKEII